MRDLSLPFVWAAATGSSTVAPERRRLDAESTGAGESPALLGGSPFMLIEPTASNAVGNQVVASLH